MNKRLLPMIALAAIFAAAGTALAFASDSPDGGRQALLEETADSDLQAPVAGDIAAACAADFEGECQDTVGVGITLGQAECAEGAPEPCLDTIAPGEPYPTVVDTGAYQVSVQFNASVTQADLDLAADLLSRYGADLLILERFPPAGSALVKSEAPDFCATVTAALQSPAVERIECSIAQEPAPVDPDAPVSSDPGAPPPGPVTSGDGVDPDECNLVHNIDACAGCERLADDLIACSEPGYNPSEPEPDAPPPVTSGDEIDPAECSVVHNVDAC